MSDEKFHNHLDICERCAKEPFNLCPLGYRLLTEAASSSADSMLKGLAQWSKVVNKS